MPVHRGADGGLRHRGLAGQRRTHPAALHHGQPAGPALHQRGRQLQRPRRGVPRRRRLQLRVRQPPGVDGLRPLLPRQVRAGRLQARRHRRRPGSSRRRRWPSAGRRRSACPPTALEATVARWNEHAAAGDDPDFGRGRSAHDRWWGDPDFGDDVRATLGPIDTPPYYAVQVHSGALGTKGGPRTDGDGRVLDVDGHPIVGLYAAGNVMGSVMGMTYGGAGGTLGPGHGVRLPRRPSRGRHRRCTSVTAAGGGAPWWRRAVIYQVYVRSFADSDGDGIGDLPGVRSRLGYIADLGVDAIWLNPFYPSPQADAGYDVSDYRDVDPAFGTLADFDALVADAHGLGLRVIVDLVPNHTSSEHPWFRAALAAAPGSRRAGPLHLPGRAGGRTATCRPTTGRACSADRRGPGSPRPTAAGPVVPAPLRPRAARPGLDQRRGAGRVRVDPALLARPGRRRVPHRRGPRPGQGPGPARHRRRPRHRRAPAGDRPPPLGPGRGPRGLPAVAADHRLLRPATSPSWPRRGWRRPSSWPATCGPTSCTPPSTSSSCWPRGTPAALRAAIDDEHRRPGRGGGAARRGCCRTTTSSATSPATAAARSGVRRARAAALLMLALPGGAYVYQGEELGLPAGDRPARRGAAGPDVPPHRGRRAGPRRLPGAAAVVGSGAAVRLRPGGGSRGCPSRPAGPR